MGLHSDGVLESSSNTADLDAIVFRRSLHMGGFLLWSLFLVYSLLHREEIPLQIKNHSDTILWLISTTF
jgi:hypothetical protein